MESCIYEGRVKHARSQPTDHRFSYGLFMMYLDLDELPTLFSKRWFWSCRRPALARFRRENHLGPSDQTLAESVRDLVKAETGRHPAGAIRLLTNLSYFGYCFNPVSFYYCFDSSGETVETIVAEVNNTPWGERDTYVLPCAGGRRSWRFEPCKKMHVSPFMPMDVEYDWRLTSPDEWLMVHMANKRDGERIFHAGMALQRKAANGRNLAGVLLRFPFMTAKIIGAIYWQALKLWLKRVPFFEHPEKQQKVAAR